MGRKADYSYHIGWLGFTGLQLHPRYLFESTREERAGAGVFLAIGAKRRTVAGRGGEEPT